MYKVTGKYSAIVKVTSGKEAYAVDITNKTVRNVADMTIGEMDDNLIYITENAQSEENTGKTDNSNAENGADEYEKIRENTKIAPAQPSEAENAEVKITETPKSSSADTDSEDVEKSTKKKVTEEEKKRKKAEANAKFKEQEERKRQTEKWVDLHALGMSKTQIAKEYGKAISTVSSHIEDYIKEARLKIDLGKFMALRNAKWDNKKIASEFHVTEGAITLLIERGM